MVSGFIPKDPRYLGFLMVSILGTNKMVWVSIACGGTLDPGTYPDVLFFRVYLVDTLPQTNMAACIEFCRSIITFITLRVQGPTKIGFRAQIPLVL